MKYLQYLGVRENLTFKMNYLVCGPYHCEGPGYVMEVDDVDAVEMLRQNPGGFREVEKPVQAAPPAGGGSDDAGDSGDSGESAEDLAARTCETCGKVLKSPKGLASHIRLTHGDQDDAES